MIKKDRYIVNFKSLEINLFLNIFQLTAKYSGDKFGVNTYFKCLPPSQQGFG